MTRKREIGENTDMFSVFVSQGHLSICSPLWGYEHYIFGVFDYIHDFEIKIYYTLYA